MSWQDAIKKYDDIQYLEIRRLERSLSQLGFAINHLDEWDEDEDGDRPTPTEIKNWRVIINSLIHNIKIINTSLDKIEALKKAIPQEFKGFAYEFDGVYELKDLEDN